MSFNLNTQVYKNCSISTDELVVPIGDYLANPVLFNKVPLPGAVGYEKDNQTLYYGDGIQWKKIGTTGLNGPTGHSGSTGIGFSGSSGPTGLGATGSTGEIGLGSTGSTGQIGAGDTGSAGQLGSIGPTGQQGTSPTMDYGFVSKTITSGTSVSLGANQPIPFDNFTVGGAMTFNGGPTYSLQIGTSGIYWATFGYGNIQGVVNQTVPQSFSLARSGTSLGDHYTIQELFDGVPIFASRSYFNVGGQTCNTMMQLNAGDTISVINTITNPSNLPRIFENRVFENGNSTSGSVLGWLTLVKIA